LGRPEPFFQKGSRCLLSFKKVGGKFLGVLNPFFKRVHGAKLSSKESGGRRLFYAYLEADGGTHLVVNGHFRERGHADQFYACGGEEAS